MAWGWNRQLVAIAIVAAAISTLTFIAQSSGAKPIGSALEQLCVAAGTKMPVVVKDENSLGNRIPEQGQGWSLEQHLRLVPAACNGKYKRLTSVRPEVQDPKYRSRWEGVTKPRWTLVSGENSGFGEPSDDPNSVSFADAAGSQFLIVDAPDGKGVPYYRCTPGSRNTGARVAIRSRVIKVKSGKTVRQRLRTFPIAVVGAC